MSVFKPRLAWHSQEASKTSLTKVQFRKGCCTSISPLLLSKTDWANCLSHSLVTSFFSINELRHSYPYRDSFVPHVRVFTSHVTHSLYIPLPSLVDIVFQIFSGIADSSNRNFWIPESRLSWIGRHSTLLSFDCEESNGCWTRFTCACSARTLKVSTALEPTSDIFHRLQVGLLNKYSDPSS